MGAEVLTDILSDASLLARVKHWTGFDRAIAFTVLGRFWSALVALVTVLLLARFLTAKEQGYYYTFFSLVAIQIVFELGFSFVVLQLAAHERTHLTFLPTGRVEGSTVAHSRMASILQKSVGWYSAAAGLMATILLPIGFYFFNHHRSAGPDVLWRGPWIILVLAAAVTFQIDPVLSFLEGCGYISQVAGMRLSQNILGAVLSWTAMVTHHGLYSPAMMIVGQAIVGISFLFTAPRRPLLGGLWHYPVKEHFVGWRREIWPFQWRIALSWFCGYFIFQLFTPVLFAYQGAVVAGQMGMSLTVSAGIASVAIAWMSTKASTFGNLIASGKIAQLDASFFATLRQSSLLLVLCATTFFLILVIAGPRFPHLAARVLPPRIFAVLLLTAIVNHVISSEALYLRAHKREPFLLLTIVCSLVLSTSTLLLGRFVGAGAVAMGHLATTLLIGLPLATYIFVTKRREWHGSTASAPPGLYAKTTSW